MTTPPGQPTIASPQIAARHDFAAKLKQPALHGRVMDYVAWQRSVRAAEKAGQPIPEMPRWSPLSINLDLTTACNYRCTHCIDWDILNSSVRHDWDRLQDSLRHMAETGLKSVILIGGGEPTVHPKFGDCVRLLKELGLQVAVVSNGSRNQVIYEVFDLLDEHDWVRFSLDSGTNETFRTMHNPVKDITLDEICSWIPKLREKNSKPQVGFSYIIVWEGAEREEGVKVISNIEEIVTATKRARDYRFSYISLKPFLTRQADGAEVMAPEDAEDLRRTVARVRELVDEAKTLGTSEFRVIESINLVMLEQGTWKDYTKQPKTCHMQALRQVLTPLGTYNCPAHRGVDKALIASKLAYSDKATQAEAVRGTMDRLANFDASKECAEVTCLYNQTNWWLENAIEGQLDPAQLAALGERYDYFL
ncbi:MAG: radical SAM protein [Planctomycetes bacterium]|nr:radical SAM protein [Planctomycetota bacterium]